MFPLNWLSANEGFNFCIQMDTLDISDVLRKRLGKADRAETA